jgi:hypothetical protein
VGLPRHSWVAGQGNDRPRRTASLHQWDTLAGSLVLGAARPAAVPEGAAPGADVRTVNRKRTRIRSSVSSTVNSSAIGWKNARPRSRALRLSTPLRQDQVCVHPMRAPDSIMA